MDAFISSLLERLLATSVQTALLTIVVWAICRYVRRLAPASQCWLWWLVALQTLVGLTANPVQLPWLPPTPTIIAEAVPSPALILTGTGAVEKMPAADASVQPVWPLAFFMLWMVGILAMCWSTLRGWRRGRELLRTSLPCTDGNLLHALACACEACGLRAAPRLHLSKEVDSPLLIGHLRPTLLLPACARLDDAELTMVLAHELAHLRRGDLWWGCIPALARHCFFFHPLAHLAEREYGIAREAACDAAAVHAGARSRRDYGRLLLRLGTAPDSGTGLASASPTFRSLEKRLNMLQNTSFLPRTGSIALLIVVAAVGVMPLRLVAAAGTPAKARVATGPRDQVSAMQQSARNIPDDDLPESMPVADNVAHQQRLGTQGDRAASQSDADRRLQTERFLQSVMRTMSAQKSSTERLQQAEVRQALEAALAEQPEADRRALTGRFWAALVARQQSAPANAANPGAIFRSQAAAHAGQSDSARRDSVLRALLEAAAATKDRGRAAGTPDKPDPLGFVDATRADFEKEAVDPSWGPAAETAILRDISRLASDGQLALTGQEISCRAQTCRVLLTHLDQPTSWDEFMRLSGRVAEIARRITTEGSTVIGVMPIYRGGFTGEPMTSELFFFRSRSWSYGVVVKTPFKFPWQQPIQGAQNQ